MSIKRQKGFLAFVLVSLFLLSTACGGTKAPAGKSPVTSPNPKTAATQAPRPTATDTQASIISPTPLLPSPSATGPALPPVWMTPTPSAGGAASTSTPTPGASSLPAFKSLAGGSYILYLTHRATTPNNDQSLIAFSPSSKVNVDLADNLPGSALAASRLSGDKTRLAYLAGSRSLVILDLAQNTSTTIALDRDCDGLSWSPKGDQLLMACGDIYVFTLASQTWQALTTSTHPNEWSGPAWSPDGKWLAYIHPAASQPPERPTATPTVSYKTRTPQPSPIPPAVENPLDGLYLVNTVCLSKPASCGSFTNFVQAWLYATAPPVWSPDSTFVATYAMGTIILYNSVGDYRGEIDLPELHAPTWAYQPITWSPDGQWLAVSGARGDPNSQLGIVSLKAASFYQMTTGDTPVALLDWFSLPTFAIGKSYTVSMAGDTLHIHETPSVDGTLVRRLKHGDTFTILDGPVYAEGYIWWKIQEKIEQTQGWIAENPDWVVNATP